MRNRTSGAEWERLLSRWGAAVTYVGMVSGVGLMLVAILLRSPDTRSNFQATAEGYHRSPLGSFSQIAAYPGLSSDLGSTGATVYFGAGCAGCHGLRGEGGIAGPPIWTLSLKTVTDAIRDGAPAVMPTFGPDRLSDAQIAAVVAYLKEERSKAPNDPERKPARAGQQVDSATSGKAP